MTRFPLSWPAGRPRTPAHKRTRSNFKTTFAEARDAVLHELKLLGAKDIILSTNVALRRDDIPYANQPEPEDAGVAVYFAHKGRAVAFACDRWDRVRDNLQAVRHTIEAIRGIARWGTGDMVEAAFTGFQQLPPASSGPRPWWVVLGVSNQDATDHVREAFRRLSAESHPDRNPGDGATTDRFIEVQTAWEAFKKERGL